MNSFDARQIISCLMDTKPVEANSGFAVWKHTAEKIGQHILSERWEENENYTENYNEEIINAETAFKGITEEGNPVSKTNDQKQELVNMLSKEGVFIDITRY